LETFVEKVCVMRRTIVLPAILMVSALAVSLGSGGDIAQALSGEDSPQSDVSPESDASSEISAVSPTQVEKKLHTVPEDGDTVGAFEFVPIWLRELLDSRPFEDLVVCVAGCPPHRDRVVYARLKESLAPTPVARNEPQPPSPQTSDAVPADGAEPPNSKAEAPADEKKSADAPGNDDERSFVPTFNLPLATDGESPAKP
jgi:hypothetical protein